MAIITTDSKHYGNIASAIRAKRSLSDMYKPGEMADAIYAIGEDEVKRGSFTGATCPVTFKNNPNIYENEWEYKSDYNITITGLNSVATITGNGTKNVKVAFDVTDSTDSITLFNIHLSNEIDFEGRFFYYGAEIPSNHCLAVHTKYAPETGTAGNFTDNYGFIVSTTYPLFLSQTTLWNNVYPHQIIGFIFGKKASYIGDGFLEGCYSFNQPLTIPDSIAGIGKEFMMACRTFNQHLTLPANLNSIGNYFMANCYSFNQPLTIPDKSKYIGSQFLYFCYSFNQPLILPSNMPFIASYFMTYCYSFNQPLTIDSAQVDFQFMVNCYSFNQPLTFLKNNVVVDDYFMSYCQSFNQPLTIDFSRIGNNFMSTCYSFNQPLVIPSTLTEIGEQFMYECYSFTFLNYNASVYPTNYSLTQSINSKTSTFGTGIKITGTKAAELKAALPDRTNSPYRKLV